MPRSSNPFAAYYLARHVREKLHSSLHYSNAINVSSPDSLKGLKEQLLTGPVEITISGDTWFSVTLPTKQYHEAICKRHFYGVRRVRRLGQCAKRLTGVKWTSAWTLTTVYYAAFFAALELLETTGRHVSTFSASEAAMISERALPSRFRLNAGTYLGVATVSLPDDEVEVVYRQNSTKPHEFAWHELDGLVRSVALTDPRALRHQEAFRRFLGAKASWAKPNEVRNLWNYGEARLFSEHGEAIAEDFVRLVQDPVAVIPWALGRHLHNSQEHEATGIAYLQTSLVQAVDAVADAVLPAALAKQCAA